MRYHQIIKYRRDGDILRAYRVTRYPVGYLPPELRAQMPGEIYGPVAEFVKAVDFPEMFGNHTSWVADQIAQAQAQYRRAA